MDEISYTYPRFRKIKIVAIIEIILKSVNMKEQDAVSTQNVYFYENEMKE